MEWSPEPIDEPRLPVSRPWTHRVAAGALATVAALGMVHESAGPADAITGVQNVYKNPDLVNVKPVDKSFTVGTDNILGSNHVGSGHAIGGTVAARARRSTYIIKGGGDAPRQDIAAVQEMEPDQFRMFRRRMPGYGVASDVHDRMNTVFFLRSRFKLLGSHVINYTYYGDAYFERHHGHAIDARLQDRKSGVVYNVINAHYAAWNLDRGSDDQGAQKRFRTAETLLSAAHADHRAHPRDVQIQTADENADYFRRNHPTADTYYDEPRDRAVTRDQLPDCVLTKKPAFLQNTYYPAIGEHGHCPVKVSPFPISQYNIDHLYYTPPPKEGVGTYVVKWQRVRNKVTRHASDHDPIVATFERGRAS
jgi:hypothetical protein